MLIAATMLRSSPSIAPDDRAGFVPGQSSSRLSVHVVTAPNERQPMPPLSRWIAHTPMTEDVGDDRGWKVVHAGTLSDIDAARAPTRRSAS